MARRLCAPYFTNSRLKRKRPAWCLRTITGQRIIHTMKLHSLETKHKPPLPLFVRGNRYRTIPHAKIKRWQVDGNLLVTNIEVANV